VSVFLKIRSIAVVFLTHSLLGFTGSGRIRYVEPFFESQRNNILHGSMFGRYVIAHES